ncbi:glycosyl transferase family 2 [Neobacillus piezotolerans]|uniref:Glycosyl transferase family 2 n=1 Tax=Neobacillus piezotolerans TaxID=2259171 RepID=A0A3D8GP27_9BACI|nr:glycosyltransferase [Neobacillus piezotolerans]RDU36041.1 glycosyl transferase family 2 [Neobacillus piezotolerans]
MNRIAVLIPVFNNQEGLLLTIASFVNEKEEAVDIYVVDDGSTPAITCPDKINQHAVHVVRMAENKGIEYALNHGLNTIRGGNYEYIARIDAGDRVLKNRFSKQAFFLSENKEIALAGSYSNFKTKEGTLHFTYKPPKTYKAIKRKMHMNSCFSHPAVMFRADLIDKVGPYSLAYKSAEDYEFFFRIVNRYQTANLDDVLLEEEFNDTGISATRRRQQLFSRLKVQLKYFDFTEVYSYLGIFKTAALFMIPRSFIERVKSSGSVLVQSENEGEP